MGTLYVVGTPIGNLEDMSPRAVRVLKEVRLIAAEDTRTTGRLLAHFDIHTPLVSYHEHNKLTRLKQIFDALSEGDVALVSEAGMPGISDPGYELIRQAIERGVPVVPVPGPTALITALAVSGLPTDSFVYLGFLPRRPVDRRRLLEELATERRTLVCYEAPHRLVETLSDMEAILGGDRPIAVARELTKLYEEIWRGKISEAAAYFAEAPPRGEVTLVIGGASEAGPWSEDRVRAAVEEKLAAGLSKKEAAKTVAQMAGWNQREVYRLIIKS